MSVHRLLVLHLCVFAALSGVLGAQAQSRPAALSPDWKLAIEQGIEWCAPVDGEPGTALLVCTKDARVDVTDIQTGASRVSDPLAVQQGTQFAGSLGAIAYAYGPSQVYAFRVRPGDEAGTAKAGLLWATNAAPSATTEGDPEFMTRLVAAHATPVGVLLVRSDGRVAELNREDGSVRWQDKLPEFSHCTLHVRENTAALLWKGWDSIHVAFIDLTADRPRPEMVQYKGTPPIWTTLLPEGVVAVWPSQFSIISPEGKQRFGRMHFRAPARAGSVAVYFHSTHSTTQPDGPAKPPILLVGGHFVSAYDLSTGKLRSPDEDRLWAPLAPDDYCARLRICGELILCTGISRFQVLGVPGDAEPLAQGYCEGVVLDVGISGGFAYGLFWDLRAPRPSTESAPKLILRRLRLEAAVPRIQTRGTSASREFHLGGAETVHDTFWLGRKLVIVEDKRIRAYTLP